MMMIRHLVNKRSSHQQHKSSPLCHEQSGKVRLKSKTRATAPTKKPFVMSGKRRFMLKLLE